MPLMFQDKRLRGTAFLLFLYLGGVAHWLFFFSHPREAGMADCTGGDWRLAEHYHNALRQAFAYKEIPWQLDFTHYSDRFLALPVTPLSPQFVLLPWISDAPFNLLNILLLYTCCFVGLLWLQREHGLSWLPFAFLFLLYQFNGYLTAHVSQGHFMWYGYFFFPFFHVLALRWLRNPDSRRTELGMAVVLAIMMLQGAFHVCIWLIYCMLFLALFDRRLRLPVFRSLLWASGLCFYRFLPGLLSMGGIKLDFVTSYGSLNVLWEALTEIKPVHWEDSLGQFGGLPWWEIDCFVGLTGALLLLYFGIFRARNQGKEDGFQVMDWANLAMLLFCCGSMLGVLGSLNIPFFSSQRIATRLIIVPLTTLMVLAAIRMEVLFRERPKDTALRMFIGLCLALMTYELYQHSAAWQITYTDELFAEKSFYPTQGGLLRPPDWTGEGMRLYAWSVAAGWCVSAVSGAAWLFVFRRTKPAANA
jgi:hypothetical protein